MSSERGWEIDCIDLVELVTGYLEGALDEERRITIEAHLRLCDGCQTYVEQIRETVRVLGHLPLHDAQDLPDEVRRQLLAAFRAERPR
ncbi:MAG TPA: zf-HC2 domain-containing protein [Streptosporangiaceae bacterium]|nr:zf-HC2 domain-containing protein [Streptosporangiaceae bacterium]